jgi:GNAT superfamily N-acetyltransferase
VVNEAVEIRRLGPEEASALVAALAEVLVDCVEGGASVSFMAPFSQAEGEAFFRNVAEGVAAGERVLLAAFDGRVLVGTVQMVPAAPPNQPHRADIAKLLVARTVRGRGIGRLLMEEAEREAARMGKTLLVLDTVTGGDGERLYQRLGWTKVGVIPDYALMPDGALTATTIFWKVPERQDSARS